MNTLREILEAESLFNTPSEIITESGEENVHYINPEDVQVVEESTKSPTGEPVKNYIPSRKEIEENLEKEQEEEKMQNLTHGNKCGKCQKFQRQTPNMKSNMGYCLFHGVMVTQFATSCEKYIFNNKPESAWG